MFRKKEAFDCVNVDVMSNGREEIMAFDNLEYYCDVRKTNFGRVVVLEEEMEWLKR